MQATIASAASIVVGTLLSSTRWYWAVLASFIVFIGTASAGETVQKLWGRVGGTLIGVGAGIALAAIIPANRIVEVSIIVILGAAGLYLRPLSYGAMIFAITVVLGLLYSMMGSSADSLLLVRLEETAIGAVFGGLAATLLFPVRTRDTLAASADRYLDALNASLDASIATFRHTPSDCTPRDASRSLDAALADLQQRSVVALTACSFYARRIARLAQRGAQSDPAELERFASAIRELAEAFKLERPAPNAEPTTHAIEQTLVAHDLEMIVRTLHRIVDARTTPAAS